jgi:hypothetical protein
MQDSPFKNINIDTVGNPAVDINSDALSFGEIITQVLPWLFGAAGIVLAFNIVSSGLKMMTSGGDPKALQSAQSKLSTSAIGILILFTSFWITQLIMQFFGLNMTLFN